MIATPMEHMGLFAREGAVVPVGKRYHTVTQKQGPARQTPDGVDVVLEDEGGVVGLDDWRGVKIFPGHEGNAYRGQWTEDDGISATPDKTVVEVEYVGGKDEVTIGFKLTEHKFKTLWGRKLAVLLPVGDERSVKGGKEDVWEGRKVWNIEF